MNEKKRGRPCFEPSVDQRLTVEQMKFVGEPDTVIARAIGISPATLRLHFRDEMANGHAHRRKQVIGLLFDQAEKGNVSALKHLEAMGRATETGAKVPAEKVGKKETAKIAAHRVTGKFAPPEMPKLVVNNK